MTFSFLFILNSVLFGIGLAGVRVGGKIGAKLAGKAPPRPRRDHPDRNRDLCDRDPAIAGRTGI